jgi:transcriptional regulator with XRE-family HTH domain
MTREPEQMAFRDGLRTLFREVMKAEGITQKDLAKLVGVTPARINQLLMCKKGNPGMNTDTIWRVSNALGYIPSLTLTPKRVFDEEDPFATTVAGQERALWTSWTLAKATRRAAAELAREENRELENSDGD